MAITKTFITNGGAKAQDTAAWLTQNAAEYFDDISVIENYKVICKVGELAMLTIAFESSTTFKYIVKNADNSAVTVSTDAGTVFPFFTHGVKTEHGIVLYNTILQASTKYFPPIIITKDKDGNTAVIFATIAKTFFSFFDLFGDNSYAAVSSTSRGGVRAVAIKSFPLNWNGDKTILAPVTTTDASEILLPNVYRIVQPQTVGCGVIEIDGVRYYSNSVFAVKDV